MESKVLSIVAEIRKRQLARAREAAEKAHRREPLAVVEAAETMQQLDALDFEEALAGLESVDDPAAVEAAAGLRCARAIRACVNGDEAAGLAEWEAVIAAHPTLIIPFITRGRWWMQHKNDPERALADFERAVAVDPQDAAGYRWRAACFEELGDVQRALANYRRAATLDPDDVDLQYAVATALTENGEHEEALAAWTRLVALEPKYVDFWAGLARERKEAGEYDAALAAYDRALAVAPDDEDLRLERVALVMEHAPPGQVGAEVGDEMERLAGDDPALTALLAPVHVQRAMAHAAAQRMQEAFDEASRAIELDPTFSAAWMIRGIYRAALDHEPALAIADMDRAVALTPDNPSAHFQRGVVLRWAEEMPAAIAACDRAIALAPERGRFYWERASWRSELDFDQRPDDMDELDFADYESALANGYRDSEVFLHKADTLAQRGQLAEAIATLDEAAAELPEDDWIYSWRAEYKRRLGDAEGARADDAMCERLGGTSLLHGRDA